MNKLWFRVTYIAFVAVFTFVLYLGIPEHPIVDFFIAATISAVFILFLSAFNEMANKNEDGIDILSISDTSERSVESEPLRILNYELLNTHTSLSWKYKLINDFCYDHPELIEKLKKSEKYKIWRQDVIDWARDNLYRLDGFFLSDGLVWYMDNPSSEGRAIVNLKEEYNKPTNPEDIVICDVEFKNRRLPDDYFEAPGLVWEDEDFDYYGKARKRNDAADAITFGIGLGVGLGIGGSNDGGCDWCGFAFE